MKQILHTLRMPVETADLIRGMHPDLKKKIKAGLRAIMGDPQVGKPLRDELAGLHSMRVSKLRIIYRVSRREIEIVAVGPRIKIYEETYKLLQKEMKKKYGKSRTDS
jgi:mRNA interferase RelE/StbE